MKKCPYCAEEIQDDAIKCRWCQSWLVEEVPAGADTPPKAAAASSVDSPASSTSSSPASATPEAAPSPATAPAQAAPATFQSAPVQAAPAQATPQAAPAQVAAQSAPAAAPAETKTEFTHTGSRYLLGYGGDFFGIWDRNAPQQPIERFPRNDQGWATAWARYASIETNWMDLRTGQKSG